MGALPKSRGPTMRRSLAGVLAVSLAAVAAVAVQIAIRTASAAAADPYTWKNVQIEGGGFVPGIIFSQTERNLIYARTDIGGAYRWDESTQRWIPLTDSFGWANWGF